MRIEYENKFTDPDFIAVYVSQLHAHVIPNRAFSSEAQKEEFPALVQDKITASRTK